MEDLRSLSFDELTDKIKEMGFPAYRAKQMYEWMHVHLVRSLDEMTNIPKDLREKCRENFLFTALEIERMQESQIDGTRKYLFKCADGSRVESVFMRYDFGNSVCVSSQVGCKMGCRFCASTLDGWSRNLIPGEILDQIYSISRDTGERVSHVVVMGTGEPMDNYDNVVRFIRMLTDENGLNISQRNVTVSTCGIVPKMYDLANENLAITLALSLHAVNDEKRRTIMPVAERYSIAELMDVCRNYFDVTGRRITFEYSLIAGVNDSKEDSDALARLADGVMAHVNLIPVNPIKERDFVQPTRAAAESFKYRLEKKGISVTIRREMGRDIDGACGQLRRRRMEETSC